MNGVSAIRSRWTASCSGCLTHFGNIPLGNRNLAEPDVLGNAYEYPDRAICRRERQEGRRVLHAPHGGQAHRAVAQADGKNADSRSDVRFRRHVDRVRQLCHRPRRRLSQHHAHRPGKELWHLVDRQAEHDVAQLPRYRHPGRRHHSPAAVREGRRARRVRSGDCQSAVLAQGMARRRSRSGIEQGR